MSRNEDVTTAIWTDPDFFSLPADAKLLYLWSWSNEHNGMAGLYQIPEAVMSLETGLAMDRLRAALVALAEARFAFYEDSVLWVRSRVKRLRSKSPKMGLAVAKDLRNIDDNHPLKVRFLEAYSDDAWLRDALKNAYRTPFENLSSKPIGKGDSHRFSEPSRKVPGTGTGTGPRGSSSSKTNDEGSVDSGKVEVPDGFPVDLLPNLRIAYRALDDLAHRHNARKITPLSLAAVVMANAHKPIVRCAYEFVAWADGQPQPRKDVVSGYSNWLRKAPDLTGYEELAPDGLPASNGRAMGITALDVERLAGVDRIIKSRQKGTS
jgi:hypothetical protein